MYLVPLAYQADLAYGTKANRIRGYYHDIMINGEHWFNKEGVEQKLKSDTQSRKS